MQGRRRATEKHGSTRLAGRQAAAAAAAAAQEFSQVSLSWAEPGSRSVQQRSDDTFGSEPARPDCRGSGVMVCGASSAVGLLSEPASGTGLGWLRRAAGASSGPGPPTVFTVTSTAGSTVSVRGSGCWGMLGTAVASAFCEVVQKCLITCANRVWSKCYLKIPSTKLCSSLKPTGR